MPDGARDPATLPSAAAAAPDSCDPLASFRPPASMPAPGGMPAGSTMAEIAARGHLTVGVSQNTYLFGSRDPFSGKLVGFDIDVAREVAKAIFGNPDKILFRTVSSKDRVDVIKNKQVDLVVSTMTMNCARWKDVSFSTEYYRAGQRVLVPVGSTAKGIDDLGGKRVCAAEGSTSLPNIAAARSRPIPVSTVDWTDCLVMLQQGQVDAVSTDDTILAGLAEQDPNTQVVGASFTAEPYGIAVSPSSRGLVQFVNGVLARMRSDGTWAAIYRHWLTKLGPTPAPPAARYRS